MSEKGKSTMRRVGAEAGGGTAPGGGDVNVRVELDAAGLAEALRPFHETLIAGVKASIAEGERRQAAMLEALDRMGKIAADGRELHVHAPITVEPARVTVHTPMPPAPTVNVAASPVPVRIEAIPPAVSFTHETGLSVRAVATLVAAELVAAAAIAVPLWCWYFQGKI